MNERLDFLLSVEMDGELQPAEREELDRILIEQPDAAHRREHLQSVDALIRTLSAQPEVGTGDSDVEVDRRLAALRERIAEVDSVQSEDPLMRGRSSMSWAPVLAVAAAAAVAVLSFLPGRGPIDASVDESTRTSTQTPTGVSAEAWGRVDDPIALAVVFELDDEEDSIEIIDSVTAEDLEIIEQLELLEFLAHRRTEGRG